MELENRAKTLLNDETCHLAILISLVKGELDRIGGRKKVKSLRTECVGMLTKQTKSARVRVFVACEGFMTWPLMHFEYK